MPLSDHEQQILDEIERRLQEEDPRFATTVGRTSLYAHMARRIRWAVLAFLAGFVMLMLFAVSVWVAVAGFAVMLGSALLIYHQLRMMGQEQVREYSRGGRFSLTGFLARLNERFRGNQRGRG
jgi:Protein of unknown function (DUF3040)